MLRVQSNINAHRWNPESSGPNLRPAGQSRVRLPGKKNDGSTGQPAPIRSSNGILTSWRCLVRGQESGNQQTDKCQQMAKQAGASHPARRACRPAPLGGWLRQEELGMDLGTTLFLINLSMHSRHKERRCREGWAGLAHGTTLKPSEASVPQQEDSILSSPWVVSQTQRERRDSNEIPWLRHATEARLHRDFFAASIEQTLLALTCRVRGEVPSRALAIEEQTSRALRPADGGQQLARERYDRRRDQLRGEHLLWVRDDSDTIQ